jgi:gliding motility-associated lipoprotein GldH
MNKYTLLYLLVGMVMVFTSCQEHIVYNHYESTAIGGWERNDTLSFDIEPMEEAGYYEEVVGLRINGEYPFMGLDLVVKQTVLPSQETRTDTLECNLIDNSGHAKGKGINHYQYLLPLTTLKLEKGDSLHVTIHHCMKREILPGISDVGLQLSRQVAGSVKTKKDEK